MSGVRIKFKRLRLFLDDLYSFFRGWYLRFAHSKADKSDYSRLKVVSQFSTDIKWREELGEINRNRIENMMLCCKFINGLRIKKGEVFSLKKMIGEPTPKRGFKEGPVIVRGELRMSSGGGLCQVSTTVFNAALTANLKILQKYNHSTDLWGDNRFIGLGRDAAYVYARRDLKFKNSHGSDIVVLMEVDEQNLKLKCSILSENELSHKVQIESRVLKELALGKRAKRIGDQNPGYRKGWLVETKRYVINDNDVKKVTYYKREKYKPASNVSDGGVSNESQNYRNSIGNQG